MGERRQVIEHPDEGEGLSAIAKAITECFSVEKIEEMIAEAEAAQQQQEADQ